MGRRETDVQVVSKFMEGKKTAPIEVLESDADVKRAIAREAKEIASADSRSSRTLKERVICRDQPQ